MEDTFVNLLLADPSIEKTVSTALNIKPPSAVAEADVRRFVKKWETKEPAEPIAIRWIDMLTRCGVRVRHEPHSDEIVNEINEVRNCILHRHGIIDTKAVAKASTLGPLLGQAIAIDSPQYMAYFDGLAGFVARVSSALNESKYEAIPPTAAPGFERSHTS